MYPSHDMNQNKRHVNGTPNASDRSRSGVRVRPSLAAAVPPGTREKGALERRSVARRSGHLLATTLTLLAVGLIAAIVGDLLGRLLVL